ncbi:MAG: hypothetical protein WA776_10945 [Xanthobacteraceae bacterium]
MSVVIAKCVAAYQDETISRRTPAAITGHAYRAQRSIARTTRAVIVFMGWSAQRTDEGDRRIGTGLRRQDKGEMVTEQSLWEGIDALNGSKSEILDIFLFSAPFAAVDGPP